MKARHTLVVSFVFLIAGLILLPASACAQSEIILDDPDGVAGRAGAPVSVALNLPRGQSVALLREKATGKETPAQFVPDQPGGGAARAKIPGKLWWLMPPGEKGQRTFALLPPKPIVVKPILRVTVAADERHVDIHERGTQVLRFHFGTAPLPKGIPARYACGGYIHPLCGPDGEALTEAHPRDHAHHRGVMWTWPVVRWKGQTRDPWAVRGMWTRPEKLNRTLAGPVLALIDATSVWKWDDKQPVVRERVVIRAFRQVGRRRYVDIEVSLTPLVDGMTIAGRPYGGFGLRMAPRKAQQITLLTDPPQAKPRRSWIEYSDTLPGGTGRVGVAIFEHTTNPRYPNKLYKYPHLNYVMPGFPGKGPETLIKGRTITLWIRPGHAEPKTLADQWTAYARPPRTTLEPAK
jgi:hypothetical protein